jgi:hypothetical protein
VDADRFDALVRSISFASRRSALGGLLGSGLTLFLAQVGVEQVAAKKCKPGRKRCNGRCIPEKDCCRDLDCAKGATCRNGDCKCPGKHGKVCRNKCVNLAKDGDNCGECGNACITGQCVNGACKCAEAAHCPGDCLCATRVDGEFPNNGACQSGVRENDTCNEDRDCPFRSFCRLVGNECAKPCRV